MQIAHEAPRALVEILAVIAAVTDFRYRRIPNWLTVPGLILGVALNSALHGWNGAEASLLGAGLGLLLLLPFVLIRSLGAGDWKLAGAIGAFVGPSALLTILFATILVVGLMALVLVIWKRRLLETVRNLGRMLAAFLTLHRPGPEVSLDNPQAVKVPFGIAVAIALLLYTARQG